MRLADCHPNRKMKAHGLCGSCYERELKAKNPEYKAKQLSNHARWLARPGNKERNAEHKRTRQLKEKNDPHFKSRIRDKRLQRMYGITSADYDLMLDTQQGGCAICMRKAKSKLHVDHCHKTGRVRGLLCHQCNWYLGTVDSDPEILIKIMAYLTPTGYEQVTNWDTWSSIDVFK